jgi:phospholipid/cholesterol/gamma-HCH transport system permease protein
MIQDQPIVAAEWRGANLRLVLAGPWMAQHGAVMETAFGQVMERLDQAENVVCDLSQVRGVDTLGALIVKKAEAVVHARGAAWEVVGASPEASILLSEVSYRGPIPARRPQQGVVESLEEVGRGVVAVGRDLSSGIAFFGAFVSAIGRLIIRPSGFRTAAFVKQLEMIAFRSVPVIVLICFLVGCIIAQQSVFQLRNFGTTAFVADLMGVLVLRELGVLLTAIMIAGRSGSAITAEIGSMKMREEIDALRTMGLDPMEVLIVPRLLALVVALPLLTFIGSMAALFGGGLVAWLYGDVAPDVYLARLQNGIRINTFMVGMIKAPVMALVIGMIAAIEGLAVKGSAESLGQQTTASVVKAIFMVIVVDGLFAMFFASIRY